MNIISNFILLVTLNFLIIKEYSILQCYHYEFNRYICHLKANKSYYMFIYCLLFLFLINNGILFMILSSLHFFVLFKKYNIKYTSRVKRFLFVNLVFLLIFMFLGIIKYIYIFSFFYLFFLHCFSLLVEEIIFLKYLKSARRKIKNKIVIGVTGSGGKTSVKNMIYDALINKYNVSKTPKSYNNRVGIVKGINEEVNKKDEYFICEYGIDKKGGMDKLLKVVKPDIAIITYIGNQHLLTFKSEENIFKEKIKLIESLSKDGVAIINNDCDVLREYDYKDKRVIRYGIKNISDVMAKNIVMDCKHSEYDLYIKDKFITRVDIPLLSIHNVENSLCVASTLLALNIDIEYIAKYINRVNKVDNRLEHKTIFDIEVIDDSFNSNIKGFINALSVLKTSSKYKIIITPGIIEQGENVKYLNKQIVENMNDIDLICLVSDNSLSLKKELVDNGFSNIESFDTFSEAFEYVKNINKEKIVLIENDLPNIYLK